MWIDRTIEEALRSAAKSRAALVVTGARQVGKSSLLTHLFPDYNYVSLDLPSEAHEAETEPSAFLARHPLPLIVDEVQYAPALFRHLKVVIDKARAARGRIVLTGSQRFVLVQHVADSLAGRVALFEVDPLSYLEIHRAHGGLPLETRILRGGYPELWANTELDARAFYSSYVATYLERDLRSMLQVGSLRDFERFLRAAALRTGQVLNKSELARDVGISPGTANEWLSVLDTSGIITLLEPWFANANKRLVKAPKLYFRDTGLVCFLVNIRDEAALRDSPLRGPIFETAALIELRKRLNLSDEVGSLFYYRDRTKEVDFLVHRGGRFDLFECKWTEQPARGDVAPMARLAEELGEDRVTSRTLLCRAPNPMRLDQARAVALDAWRGP